MLYGGRQACGGRLVQLGYAQRLHRHGADARAGQPGAEHASAVDHGRIREAGADDPRGRDGDGAGGNGAAGGVAQKQNTDRGAVSVRVLGAVFDVIKEN